MRSNLFENNISADVQLQITESQADMLTFVPFSKSFENTLNSPVGSDSPSFNVSWAFNELLFAYDTAGSWGGGAGSCHPRISVPVIRGAGMWEAEPVTRRHQTEPVLLPVSRQLILKDQRLALSEVAIATVFLSHSFVSSVKRHYLTIHSAISPLHQTSKI